MMPTKKWLTYGAAYPIACVTIGFLPYIGPALFTLHGGIGWVIMLFSGPWFIWWILFSDVKKHPIRARWRFGILALTCYTSLSVPLSALLAFYLQKKIDSEISVFVIWQTLNIPISVPFFAW